MENPKPDFMSQSQRRLLWGALVVFVLLFLREMSVLFQSWSEWNS